MTQTIEQLQARVRELGEENARLNLLFVKAAKGKGENLKECFSLQQQLAAAQEEIESNKAYFTTLLEEQRVLLAKAEQLWQVAQGRCDGLEEKLVKAEQRVAEYNELIYAVQTKNPDETRHQTALRYIRNAENRPSNAAANNSSS